MNTTPDATPDPSAGGVSCPTPDADTQPYWDALASGGLHLQRCLGCRRFQHFPAPICSSCGSFELEFAAVSGRGSVETFVVIEHITNPVFAARAPITAAWIALPEQDGLRVFADIVGCAPGEVHIGMPVELALDRAAFAPTPEYPDPPPLPRFRPSPVGSGGSPPDPSAFSAG
ncbi:MAG TPA: OB-fold domain-containing protein [Pseudonocardia sp.]|jgi:hypothetical protein